MSDASRRESQLKETFKLDYTYDVHGDIEQFCNALAVMLNFEEFDELETRIDLLADAVEVIEQHIPDAKRNIVGSALGSSLMTSAVGESYVI